MSNTEKDEDYYDRADEIIHLANDQCNDASKGKVSSSLLFATARFNAYVLSSTTSSVEELIERKQEAIDYFLEQYKIGLEDNLDDYINNYSKYMSNDENT